MNMNSVSQRWYSLMSRMKHEARTVLKKNNDGIAIITIHVMMNSSGQPLVWVVPVGKRVEPSKDASAILQSLVDAI